MRAEEELTSSRDQNADLLTGEVGLTADGTEIDPGAKDATAGTEEPTLKRGDTVGRYLIADCIGKGGMGEVYQAFDPDLNRPVALKLLTAKRTEQDERDHTNLNRSRLLREAQALAQLAHPHVVTVYDVGLFAEAVFMAMEFVDGLTLKEWLNEQAREKPCALHW